MKTTIKFVLIIVTIFSFTSCGKVQMNYNKIAGIWKLTSIKENAVTIPITGAVNQLYFEKCPMTKGGCQGNFVYNGKEESFIYFIGADGNDNHISTTTLEDNSIETIYTIIKLDKEKLELSYTKDDKLIELSFLKN